LWNAPDEGRLAGVISIDEEGMSILADTTGKQWVLNTVDMIDDAALLIDGASVRVVGRMDGDSFFTCIVLPWDLSPFPPAPPKRIVLPPHERLAISSLRCHEVLEHQRLPRERKLMLQP
jgi:hypothetical protein